MPKITQNGDFGHKKTREGTSRVTKRILQFFNQNLHTSLIYQTPCQKMNAKHDFI
jgi:hypothetical protein